MTLDNILLKALERGGPFTVKELVRYLEKPVRVRLEKLRVRGIVSREGKGGPDRPHKYKMLRPDLAAKALRARGGGLAPMNDAVEAAQTLGGAYIVRSQGLARGAMVTSEPRNGRNPPKR